MQYRGVNLPPISIALHHCIQHAQRALCRVVHLARQQNRASACAKDRVRRAVGCQRLKEPVFLQELEHCGGLAAGQNQTIQPD